MRNIGSSVWSFFLAMSLISFSPKFHERPSTSQVVKSSAKPAMTSELGIILMALVTLGGLYISDTIPFIAFVLSLRYAFCDPPRSRAIFMISSESLWAVLRMSSLPLQTLSNSIMPVSISISLSLSGYRGDLGSERVFLWYLVFNF